MAFVVLAVAVLMVALFLANRIAGGPPTTSASVDRLLLNFGLSREAVTRSLRIDLCKESATSTTSFPECSTDGEAGATRLAVVAAALEGDLSGTRAQFPTSQFTVTASNVGRSGLLINVNANPTEPEDVPDGTYTGTVIVDRSDGPPISLEVTATLEPRSGAVSRLAILTLALGALGGALIKWLDESFSPLAALRRRQRRVQVYLDGLDDDLPIGVQRRIRQIKEAIRSFDPEGVAQTLDDISKNQDALVAFAAVLKDLAAQVAIHRSLGEKTQTPKLAGVVEIERLQLETLRTQIWPWEAADTVTAELKLAQAGFRKLTAALRRLDASSSAQDRALVERIADKILQDDTEALGKVLDRTEPVSGPLSDVGEAASDEGCTAAPGDNRTVGLWLLDNAWWLTVLVIATLVVLLGYQTQFIDDASFEGEVADYLQLAAWALAIQVTGGTVVETVGKLRTSRTAV